MMHTLHCRVLIQFLNDAVYLLVNSENSCTALVGVFYFCFFWGEGIRVSIKKLNSVI